MLEMGYVESLSGFEEHFISGMSQDAELDFWHSNIVFLEESVFRPVVEILMQGSGSIVVGSKRDNFQFYHNHSGQVNQAWRVTVLSTGL